MTISPRTGANAYVLYGYESPYGTADSIIKSFGAKTAITSLTLTHNRLDLGKLGQVEPATYAFGTQTGSVGVSFVLCDTVTSVSAESSGDIFRGIYGEPSAGGIYPAGGIGQGKAPKTIESLTIDIGFNAANDGGELNVRTLKGCVLNSLALSTSIGETVNCTADFSYGDEDVPTKTFSAPTISIGTPYTFAHTTLIIYDPITPVSISPVLLVQDFDITFANNAELLYGLGSNQAVDQFRKSLDITGKFKIPVTDYKLLRAALGQIKRTGINAVETFNPTTQNGDSTPSINELSVTFTNGNRSIVIALQSVSITDLSWTGLEPTMPVYQDVSFKAKSAKITVDTSG